MRAFVPRWLLGTGLALAAWAPASAHAEPAAASAGTFQYTTPQRANYLRATLEELFWLGAGFGQYWYNRGVNSLDWDLDYSWGTFRDKLIGKDYAYDINGFDTNFLLHPSAGTLYYLSARGNRLSLLGSLGFAAAASTVWEILGEFRERVSVNDALVTPLAGFSLGEATTQLGAYFDRSCASPVHRGLGLLFGPMRSLHDALDGARLERSARCSDSAGTHRFELALGAGERKATGQPLARDVETRARSQILHLPDFDRIGRGWHTFSDGNVSELEYSGSFNQHGVDDLLVAARVIPAGAYFRNLTRRGARLYGSQALLGVLIGGEYTRHRYQPPDSAPDRIFLLDVPAVALRYWLHRRAVQLELGLDAGATVAGVDAFALERYAARGSLEDLTSVARAKGYNHAFGVAIAPELRLSLSGAELSLRARSDRFMAVRALDRSQHTSAVPVSELRRRATLSLSVGPARGARFTFSATGLERSGTIGPVKRTLRELDVAMTLGCVL